MVGINLALKPSQGFLLPADPWVELSPGFSLYSTAGATGVFLGVDVACPIIGFVDLFCTRDCGMFKYCWIMVFFFLLPSLVVGYLFVAAWMPVLLVILLGVNCWGGGLLCSCLGLWDNWGWLWLVMILPLPLD